MISNEVADSGVSMAVQESLDLKQEAVKIEPEQGVHRMRFGFKLITADIAKRLWQCSATELLPCCRGVQGSNDSCLVIRHGMGEGDFLVALRH